MSSSYDPLDFAPIDVNVMSAMLAPQRLYHRPVFFGLEHLRKDRPTLYVGNHTIFGVIDAPHIVERIYREVGRPPRSLADHAHYRVPVWRDLLHRFGAVDGTRENCRALMKAGESVLVFPGGGREVAKRKGEAYELVWKQRVGFVRMAVEHGYTIDALRVRRRRGVLLHSPRCQRSPRVAAVEVDVEGPRFEPGARRGHGDADRNGVVGHPTAAA